MSATTCPSCGCSNSPELIYCSECGALLERREGDSSSTSALPLAKRRSLRIEADHRPSPGLFSRIKGLVIYLFWVAAGVIVVLASMDPGNNGSQEKRVPDAEGVVQRVFASSRYTPSALTQAVINTVLSRQEPFAPESPVRLVPMPIWDQARVELFQGTVTLHVTISLFGRPFRVSETFRLAGGPGSWSLQPESATMGLLGLPDLLLPIVAPLIRPGFFSLTKEMECLSTARSLVIRPGLLEFTAR